MPPFIDVENGSSRKVGFRQRCFSETQKITKAMKEPGRCYRPQLQDRQVPLLLQSLLQLLSELSVLLVPILKLLQRRYFRFDYPPERIAHQNRV